jgi:two-component system chemotaxis response regulator CheV
MTSIASSASNGIGVRAPESLISGAHHYIIAITELDDGRLVSIVDVEQIMADTFGEAMVGQIGRIEGGEEYNVFFVDDSAIARKKIIEVLERLGVRHKHAQNGREAWTRLSGMAAHAQQAGHQLKDEINLILVDAEMPEMDGYVLTKHIKSDKRFAGIPVVMHSSLSSEANRAMGKAVGVDAYVAKFDSEALADTLRPLLLKSRNT